MSKPQANPPPPTRSEGETTAARYAAVKKRIAEAAARAGRRPESVLLVAVTKYAAPEQIRELIGLGHRDFGENRIQQLAQRAAIVDEYLSRHRTLPNASAEAALAAGGAPSALADLLGRLPATPSMARAGPGNAPVESVIRWHMIGHLQRNKAKKALDICRLIHSVDSLRLAEELQELALRRERPVDVLVQVNASGEPGKFGCQLPAAPHLCEQIDSMVYVRVRGVMTMAPFSTNPQDARPTFARCRELFEDVRASGAGREPGGGSHFNLLSMGMSGDYEAAIAEGANVVRVGSAIFGEPEHPEPDEPEQPETEGDTDEPAAGT